jgi:hypothetical protein
VLAGRPVLGGRSPLHQAQAPAVLRRGPAPCAAAGNDQQQQDQQPKGGGGGGPDASSLASSVGLFALWAGLVAYAFLLSPNQTPFRDRYFVEKLIGLGVDDGVPLNAIVQQLFLIMGVWPLVYTALLVPSGKSDNGVPAWPFLTVSYGVGE